MLLLLGQRADAPAISADCTGEPPGLLIGSATAGACLWANARVERPLERWPATGRGRRSADAADHAGEPRSPGSGGAPARRNRAAGAGTWRSRDSLLAGCSGQSGRARRRAGWPRPPAVKRPSGLVQHEAAAPAAAAPRALARARTITRSAARRRPATADRQWSSPARPRSAARITVQPVGAVDQRERSRAAAAVPGRRQPRRQIALALRWAARPVAVRGGGGAAARDGTADWS